MFDVADARDGVSITVRTCFSYRQVVAKRSTVERMSINEVTELSVSPSRGDFVLMDVGRRHLLVYTAVGVKLPSCLSPSPSGSEAPPRAAKLRPLEMAGVWRRYGTRSGSGAKSRIFLAVRKPNGTVYYSSLKQR